MVSIAHEKLVAILQELDQPPENFLELTEWLAGKHTIDFLLSEPCKRDIIMGAFTKHFYVYAEAYPRKSIIDEESGKFVLPTVMDGPYHNTIVSYSTSYNAGEKSYCINRLPIDKDHKRILVFKRGLHNDDEACWEPLQEFTIVNDIYYQPKRNSWSRIDGKMGDLEDHISITEDADNSKLSIISFNWKTLEKYLAYEDLVLVRTFLFEVHEAEQFVTDNVCLPRKKQVDNEEFKYEICRSNYFEREYIRVDGKQLIQPRPLEVILQEENKTEYVTFWAVDWRNKEVKEISTDPQKTTNYFETENNSLPFELSPALFRPEVLTKYKSNSDKYIITEKTITCCGAWYLKSYDINSDGLIHAYICDLRYLPYHEQLYWKSYNIKPEETNLKDVISECSYKNDFLAEFREGSPRAELLGQLQEWEDDVNISFWKLKDESLWNKAHVPVSGSRDEWAEALLQLDQIVVEGFSLKEIQGLLIRQGKEIVETEKSLACLNRLVFGSPTKSRKGSKLEALRELHDLRSKVKGHANGESARAISEGILEKFGSYAKHYEDLCKRIEGDLLRIYVSLSL